MFFSKEHLEQAKKDTLTKAATLLDGYAQFLSEQFDFMSTEFRRAVEDWRRCVELNQRRESLNAAETAEHNHLMECLSADSSIKKLSYFDYWQNKIRGDLTNLCGNNEMRRGVDIFSLCNIREFRDDDGGFLSYYSVLDGCSEDALNEFLTAHAALYEEYQTAAENERSLVQNRVLLIDAANMMLYLLSLVACVVAVVSVMSLFIANPPLFLCFSVGFAIGFTHTLFWRACVDPLANLIARNETSIDAKIKLVSNEEDEPQQVDDDQVAPTPAEKQRFFQYADALSTQVAAFRGEFPEVATFRAS